jgi:hypothetical protein
LGLERRWWISQSFFRLRANFIIFGPRYSTGRCQGSSPSSVSRGHRAAIAEGELRNQIAGLRNQKDSEINELRLEIAGLRNQKDSEISDLKTQIVGMRDQKEIALSELKIEIAGLRNQKMVKSAD